MNALFKISLIVFALAIIGNSVRSQNNSLKINPWQALAFETMDPEISSQCRQGEITVKLKVGVGDFGKQTGMVRLGIQSLDEKMADFEVNKLEKRFRYNPAKLRADLPDLSRIYKISFTDKYSLKEVVESFSSDPNVEYAEPITIGHLADVPNDALYSQMLHLPQIHAQEAWEIHKGESGTDEIIIAIVDTGVDWEHEDLLSNVWQNLGEDADNDGHTKEYNGTEWILDPGDLNGVDDDLNGFTDDLLGWNFITNTGDPNPISGNPVGYHGTHCSGISNGATNNGIGIASISWNLSLMAICTDENNTVIYGWDGIIYAAENGADIISNSWGGFGYSHADQEVMTYAAGLGSIVLAAAGNDDNSFLFYPADYEDVISVASVSVNDTKANYSCFNLAVDVSAPGGGSEGGILSTMPGNDYTLMSGTSMATPMVAGCFGLLKSYHPDWSNDQLITQLLGTADNIDTLNPDYENMLGTGRVNAYRMLIEENVMPFLKLELISVDPLDENGNGINEQGELVTLNLDLYNYMPCYGEDNVNVSILTEDPEITIINGAFSVNIPPDSSFSIQDQFQIQVGVNASCHFADITLHFESDLQITTGQDINFKVLVNPSGILVFEGEENTRDYSGTFITGFLDRLGFDYTYSNVCTSLLGFETVFLSYGNFGQNLDKGTTFSESNSFAIQAYLESGGNLYAEMGGMFYKMAKGGYANRAVMKELFGVHMASLINLENRIDTLRGVAGAPTEGMLFSRSGQFHNWHIDKLVPESGAIIPFAEQDYGNIAIMNDGSATYGYKSFYMGYSLAELYDRDTTSSKYNVLLKTMEFFGYSRPPGYLLANFVSDQRVGGQHLEVSFTDISMSDPAYPVTSWKWDFDNDGIFDSYSQNPVWNYNYLGTYDVKLIASSAVHTDTLVIVGLITINGGILVYEGVTDGADYSGSFIRDHLQGKTIPVTYTNTVPESLRGFSAVFLSYGNAGSLGTILDDHMADIIIDYLESGGYAYLEGSTNFGYFQVDNSLLFELFGLVSAVYEITENPVDSLGGLPDALTDQMLFAGNSQTSNYYIDKFESSDNAVAAFQESGYGTVAVQYSAIDGHRTFCFSYSLADLIDSETPNTREELLDRILNFFDIYTTVPDVPVSTSMRCKVYPNPASANTTIQYNLPEDNQVSLEIFNSTGQKIMQPVNGDQSKGEHFMQLNMQGIPTGIYYYSIRSGKLAQTGKIVIVK